MEIQSTCNRLEVVIFAAKNYLNNAQKQHSLAQTSEAVLLIMKRILFLFNFVERDIY